jgi:hypothetical protein
MARKTSSPTQEELGALKLAMDTAELNFDNAKVAYFHRAEYQGKEVTYDVLKGYAEQYISANYAYQKASFGRIRIKLSVARLMRE